MSHLHFLTNKWYSTYLELFCDVEEFNASGVARLDAVSVQAERNNLHAVQHIRVVHHNIKPQLRAKDSVRDSFYAKTF